ncbi:MAG TPA: hypothetical protein OIM39_00450 [Bacteroidaceae bacterium]|nr:hypothetical protein [Bacteroidaceae bacterium]
MGKRKNKQIKDIIESNIPTETKVELINKINEKSHISEFIRYIALRLGLDSIIDNIEL